MQLAEEHTSIYLPPQTGEEQTNRSNVGPVCPKWESVGIVSLVGWQRTVAVVEQFEYVCLQFIAV